MWDEKIENCVRGLHYHPHSWRFTRFQHIVVLTARAAYSDVLRLYSWVIRQKDKWSLVDSICRLPYAPFFPWEVVQSSLSQQQWRCSSSEDAAAACDVSAKGSSVELTRALVPKFLVIASHLGSLCVYQMFHNPRRKAFLQHKLYCSYG